MDPATLWKTELCKKKAACSCENAFHGFRGVSEARASTQHDDNLEKPLEPLEALEQHRTGASAAYDRSTS